MKSIISGILLLALGITLTAAVDIYQAKCSITEGAGITVDSCDASKFLSCQSGRCMCNDIGNQIYDYRYEAEKVISRSKRGLKKKIAAGVAGGAVGYVAAKSLSNSGSGSSKRKEEKYKQVFSCYGRVGSPCALDFNNVNVVTLSTSTTTTTTTTTTTEGPLVSTTIAAAGSELSNVTTPTTTPSSTTTTPAAPFDVTKSPKCIRHAICIQNKASGSTYGHIVKTDVDPRIGVCACEAGYKVTSTDRCEKSGSSEITASLPVFVSIIYAILINKFF